ncbi:hypothetical protein AVEN_56046-1 [Araneus ventricosus]|uniref:Uncharacterized protein n=1 Tax=Araneus ventricosus TaxID=182803 RepID=A0A4Y2DQ53_ARAVE|nr:hypothetical protein AVEN_56046-1 [Araneus ventricosus]
MSSNRVFKLLRIRQYVQFISSFSSQLVVAASVATVVPVRSFQFPASAKVFHHAVLSSPERCVESYFISNRSSCWNDPESCIELCHQKQ